MQCEATQFAVLIFTDICDSTALKAKHGALEYKRAAEAHNALFERLAAEEKLTLIKNTGDGYFARTTSVAAAVRFALRFQHGMRGMAWPSFALTTRVGIHAGEVADIMTLGQADVLAPAADLVARVMGLALGGQILLTRGPFDEARHFVREHPDQVDGLSLTWLAHGPYLFKGCDEPVEVFEVGLSCEAPLIAPPDGEKAKRALRPGDEETLGWRPADGLEIPGRPGWRLAEKLGAGGFGEVWAGEQAKTRERRAFKFCFDAERLRALKREVTLTRLLRETLGEREDIVRIYDLRLDEPPYFLESELATEGNLLQWAEKQGGLDKIPLAVRIALVADTAAAIGAAHSVGVLHKDIKPTNVLIFTSRDGQPHPRLVDFGIGTLADANILAHHGITGAGFTAATLAHSSGTPTYSPPEYLAGKPFTVQGDVYSLGVMLWQLVTGKADAPLAEGWQRDVEDELLREDIAACVDGDPNRRLRSADELATRLRSVESRNAELNHQRSVLAAELVRRKRQRALTFAAATAILIAAITVPLTLWAFSQKKMAETARTQAVNARDAAEKLISEAVFGLKEKLVPIGKVAVLEDLASASEEYYSKLPASLVSDETRRQQVWLALNRSIIAAAVSDDEGTAASCNKANLLAGELLGRFPNDETLREAQMMALLGLASVQQANEDYAKIRETSAMLESLSKSWLTALPVSPGALRAKLAASFCGMLAESGEAGDKTRAVALFTTASSTAEQLRSIAGETIETRLCDALSILLNGLALEKLGQTAVALENIARAGEQLQDAVASYPSHPFLKEMTLVVRHTSIIRQARVAESKKDNVAQKRLNGLLRELEREFRAVAEFEPARIESWRRLARLHNDGAGLVKSVEGREAWLTWAKEGVIAAERSLNSGTRRTNAIFACFFARSSLAKALCEVRPSGWEKYVASLVEKNAELFIPKDQPPLKIPGAYVLSESLWRYLDVMEGLAKDPTQINELRASAQTVQDLKKRYSLAYPEEKKLLEWAKAPLEKIDALLNRLDIKNEVLPAN